MGVIHNAGLAQTSVVEVFRVGFPTFHRHRGKLQRLVQRYSFVAKAATKTFHGLMYLLEGKCIFFTVF